jgi:hypothetical protein
LDRILRFGLIAAIALAVLVIPTRAASNTPTPVIEVVVSLTDLAPPTVNVSVPEQAAPIINIPETPAPIVNVQTPAVNIPKMEPATIIVEPSSTPAPQVIYQDRDVEVVKVVEVPSCLDYADLPYFDLANALTVGFPGTLWGISNGALTWNDGDVPEPSMAEIIGAWLAHLAKDC